MKTTRRTVAWWLPGLVALALWAGVVPAARAQTEAYEDDAPAVETMDGSVEPYRAIGVLGSILCGAEGYLIRTNPLLGMNPYVLAAGIGGCLLMMLDVCTT